MENIQLKGIYIQIGEIFIKDVDNNKDNIKLRSTMYAVSNKNNIYKVTYLTYRENTQASYYTTHTHLIDLNENIKINETELTENYIQIYDSVESNELLGGIFQNDEKLIKLFKGQKSRFKDGVMDAEYFDFFQPISTLQEEGNPKYKQKVLILLINFIIASLKYLESYFSEKIKHFNNTKNELNKKFNTTDNPEDIYLHVNFLNSYKIINIPKIKEEKNKLFEKEEEKLRIISTAGLTNEGEQIFEQARKKEKTVKNKKLTANLNNNLNFSKLKDDNINKMNKDILSKIDGKFAYSRKSKTLFNEFKKYLDDNKISHKLTRSMTGSMSMIEVVNMDANLTIFLKTHYDFELPESYLSILPAESNIIKRIKGSSNGEFPIVQQPVAVQPVPLQPVAVQPVVAQPVAVQPVVPKIGYNRYLVHYT